jgi:hypothetical protein
MGFRRGTNIYDIGYVRTSDGRYVVNQSQLIEALQTQGRSFPDFRTRFGTDGPEYKVIFKQQNVNELPRFIEMTRYQDFESKAIDYFNDPANISAKTYDIPDANVSTNPMDTSPIPLTAYRGDFNAKPFIDFTPPPQNVPSSWNDMGPPVSGTGNNLAFRDPDAFPNDLPFLGRQTRSDGSIETVTARNLRVIGGAAGLAVGLWFSICNIDYYRERRTWTGYVKSIAKVTESDKTYYTLTLDTAVPDPMKGCDPITPDMTNREPLILGNLAGATRDDTVTSSNGTNAYDAIKFDSEQAHFNFVRIMSDKTLRVLAKSGGSTQLTIDPEHIKAYNDQHSNAVQRGTAITVNISTGPFLHQFIGNAIRVVTDAITGGGGGGGGNAGRGGGGGDDDNFMLIASSIFSFLCTAIAAVAIFFFIRKRRMG